MCFAAEGGDFFLLIKEYEAWCCIYVSKFLIGEAAAAVCVVKR